MEADFQQLDTTVRCFIEALSRGQVNLQDLMTSPQDSFVEVVKAESKAQNTATMAISTEVQKT